VGEVAIRFSETSQWARKHSAAFGTCTFLSSGIQLLLWLVHIEFLFLFPLFHLDHQINVSFGE
jgi:hypothetical protein